MNTLNFDSLNYIIMSFLNLNWSIRRAGKIIFLRGLRSLRIADMLIFISHRSSRSTRNLLSLACIHINNIIGV